MKSSSHSSKSGNRSNRLISFFLPDLKALIPNHTHVIHFCEQYSTDMDYARTQKDIQWVVAQHLSPLALTLLNPSKLVTLTSKQLAGQPKPIFVYLCDKLWSTKSHIPYHHLIIYAALVGNLEVVHQCRAWILAAGKTPDYNWVMSYAALAGNLEVVQQCRSWILEAGKTPDYNWAMTWAAEGGHQELIKQCIAWILADGKIPHYNRAMVWAAGGGHLELVKQCRAWMLEAGKTPNYVAMSWSAHGGGHEKLIAQLKVWQQEQ